MDFSAALTDLHTLLDRLAGGDDARTAAALTTLTDGLRQAVPAFLGLQLVLHQHGHPVTLTAFDPDVNPAGISTSLRLPLTLLGVAPGDQPSAVTFHAGTPGAFVDLAADLNYALQPDPAHGNAVPTPELTPTSNHTQATITLDDPIQPTTVNSGVDGAAELSTIDRAIGMLICEGHLLDDAHVELGRRAAVAGITILACATEIIRPTQHP